jgi:hypothetical protein
VNSLQERRLKNVSKEGSALNSSLTGHGLDKEDKSSEK